jgi:hypothetical protein
MASVDEQPPLNDSSMLFHQLRLMACAVAGCPGL